MRGLDASREAGEMVQWVRLLSAQHGELSSAHSTKIRCQVYLTACLSPQGCETGSGRTLRAAVGQAR